MTNRKKTAKSKDGAKAKKLQLNKKTVKDLTARDATKVKGGAAYTMDFKC